MRNGSVKVHWQNFTLKLAKFSAEIKNIYAWAVRKWLSNVAYLWEMSPRIWIWWQKRVPCEQLEWLSWWPEMNIKRPVIWRVIGCSLWGTRRDRDSNEVPRVTNAEVRREKQLSIAEPGGNNPTDETNAWLALKIEKLRTKMAGK